MVCANIPGDSPQRPCAAASVKNLNDILGVIRAAEVDCPELIAEATEQLEYQRCLSMWGLSCYRSISIIGEPSPISLHGLPK